MKRKRVILGVILCAVAGLLAACDSGVSSQSTPTATIAGLPLPNTPTVPVILATPAAPAVPTTLATPTKPVSSGRPTAPVAGWSSKVTYEKSGGVAGIKQTLLVGPSGQARLIEGTSNSGPVRLTADRLAKIKANLDSTDFFNLQDHYGNGNVADDFILTLTLTQGNRTKTVAVEEQSGKGVTPQVLLDFITDLEALKGEIKPMPSATGTPTATATATVPQGTPPVSGTWNSTLTYERTGGYV